MCVLCKKINSCPCHYPTESNLTKYWFNDDHPVTAADYVDYVGSLYCLAVFSNNDNMKKVYVSSYTCASTKAII